MHCMLGCKENLRDILLSVYGNKESVDEELVEIIYYTMLLLILNKTFAIVPFISDFAINKQKV